MLREDVKLREAGGIVNDRALQPILESSPVCHGIREGSRATVVLSVASTLTAATTGRSFEQEFGSRMAQCKRSGWKNPGTLHGRSEVERNPDERPADVSQIGSAVVIFTQLSAKREFTAATPGR